jgi:hypothetical protein
VGCECKSAKVNYETLNSEMKFRNDSWRERESTKNTFKVVVVKFIHRFTVPDALKFLHLLSVCDLSLEVAFGISPKIMKCAIENFVLLKIRMAIK